MSSAVVRMVPPARTLAEPTLSVGHPATEVVRRQLRGIWRFLRLLGCDPDEADDLTQETFVVALQKGTGDRDDREIAAFLRRTAKHLFLRSRQRRGRRAALLAEAAERLWSERAGDDGGEAMVSALRECVGELAEQGRRLVELFYGENRSRADVAAALELRETGVKTGLQRVRAALRACLRRKLS